VGKGNPIPQVRGDGSVQGEGEGARVSLHVITATKDTSMDTSIVVDK